MTSSTQAGVPSGRLLFKNILQGSGLYSVAILGQRLASIVLLPITTRFLTPADYGVADLLEQVGVILTLVLGLQFSSALGYFYFRTEDSEARRRVVGTGVIGAVALGALVAAICWPFTSVLSRLVFGSAIGAHYLRLVFLTMPAGFLLEALFDSIRVANRPGIYVTATMVRIGVTIGGVVVLVAFLRLQVWGILYTSLAAIAAAGGFLVVYWFRHVRPKFEMGLFLQMARFAAPIGLSGVAVFLINVGDRFFLPHYRPLTDLGIYVLAYKLGMLLAVAYSAFQIYWNAQVYQIMRRDDSETVFARLFTYVVLGLSFCGLGIVVASRPALAILAAPQYQGAAALVPVIVAAYYVRAIGDFLRCLFLAAGRPVFDAICNWLGALTCVAGYVVLIPRFGIWGAAFATLAAFTVVCCVSVVWTYRLRPYRIEGGRILKVGIALAAAVPIYFAWDAASFATQAGRAGVCMGAFAATLWILRFPTAGETNAVKAALLRYR